MNRALKISLLSAAMVLFSTLLSGQRISENLDLSDTTQVHILETKRGDRFVGRILRIENTEFTFLFNQRIELKFQLAEISRILVEGEDPETEPGEKYGGTLPPEYLVYSPTGFNLPKGDWTYRNLNLLWNMVDYGVTDHFSIGAGMLVPVVFNIRAKGSIDIGEFFKWSLGQNTFIEIYDGLGMTHLFTGGTIGAPEKFLNFTVGYGFGWAADSNPLVITGGGAIDFAPNWRVMGDVLYYRDGFNNGLIPSVMVTWFNPKNRVDFGVIGIPESDIPVIPSISYQRRF